MIRSAAERGRSRPLAIRLWQGFLMFPLCCLHPREAGEWCRGRAACYNGPCSCPVIITTLGDPRKFSEPHFFQPSNERRTPTYQTCHQ